MRAMRAEQFSGYEGLKLVDVPKPAVTEGKVLVRIAAGGVTPLDRKRQRNRIWCSDRLRW